MVKSKRTSNTDKKKKDISVEKKLWAIIVGINKYQDSEIENLKFCANDACGLAEALPKIATQRLSTTETIFDRVEIIVHAHFSNKYSRSRIIAPQQDKILASLGILSQAQPQDTVLFYFSGHGKYDETIKDSIFCVEETDKNNLASTGLLISTVLAKITSSSARQQLVWLDACHSGGVASQLIDAILRVTKNNPRLYCITACSKDEKSYEAPDLQHGIFTYHLLKGLEGGVSSNLIKTDELYHFVASKTRDDILSYILH